MVRGAYGGDAFCVCKDLSKGSGKEHEADGGASGVTCLEGQGLVKSKVADRCDVEHVRQVEPQRKRTATREGVGGGSVTSVTSV
jgi:hypothetical protein